MPSEAKPRPSGLPLTRMLRVQVDGTLNLVIQSLSPDSGLAPRASLAPACYFCWWPFMFSARSTSRPQFNKALQRRFFRCVDIGHGRIE
jgi:hypothetical protein